MTLNRLPKVVLLVCWAAGSILLNSLPTEGKKKEPPTKSIHGHVVDARKRSIVGAKVFIRNVNKKTTTTLITDENGLYAIYGLDPKVDYEVHAEYGKFVSEKRGVSSFLDRFDNVFNFELGSSGTSNAASGNAVSGQSVLLNTTDQVKLAGDWYSPIVGDAKLPAVLLAPWIWTGSETVGLLVRERLLPAGFAALTVDLRGPWRKQGEGRASLTAEPGWSSDPKQFPLDIGAAIQWLKARKDVDVNRIAIIGCELGADLAFVASGKYEEVRSAIVISGDAGKCWGLDQGNTWFSTPFDSLYCCSGDSQAASSAREFEKQTGFPVRVQIYENSEARGIKILQDNPEASGLMIDWLKKM
jgi:dienelactone hydrolase